jgi:DNA-binding CsgD family transcriptional regulator
MLICTVFTFLFVLVTTRLPNPSVVYLIVFPMMITFFLLLPFFGSGFGPQISQLFYAGYVFTTLIALLYYLRAGTAFRAGLYFIIFVVTGLTRVALVVGLSLGYLFGNLHQGNEAMQLTFIAVICAYLLGTAVVAWALRDARKARKKDKQKEAEQSSSFASEPVIDGTQDKNTPTPKVDENATHADASAKPVDAKPAHTVLNLEDALRIRIEELSVRCHITPRERDVLVRLALGYSAAAIAEELVVATSTVNGYVKSIYAKLGVNRKQQVIDLFNDILVTPEPFKLIR